MNGNEDSLSAIPTDQLVLRLLNELAARVERLEAKHAVLEPKELEILSQIISDRKRNNSVSSDDSKGDLRASVDGDSEKLLHSRPGWVPPGRVLVPYGVLLDGEDTTGNLKLPRDRFGDPELTPEIRTSLKHLGGLALIPADFRIGLTNFWTQSEEQAAILESAVAFYDALKKSSGVYWVRDFDLKSKEMRYGQSQALDHGLDVPLMEVSVRNRYLKKRTGDSPRPWRRLILLQGLSEMGDQLKRRYLLSGLARTPFLSDFRADGAISMHLGNSFGEGAYIGGVYRFHLSWYRVKALPKGSPWSRLGPGELKVGQLYGSTNEQLFQESFTIHALSDNNRYGSIRNELRDKGPTEFQRYWTILLLTPPGFYRRGLKNIPFLIPDGQDETFSPMQMNIVQLIRDALQNAGRDWRGLQEYVEEFLGSGSEIFDPDLHDSLLFDDELFTGSRKYFWLIDTLQTFDKILQQNIKAWTSYRDRFMMPLSKGLENFAGTTWKAALDEDISRCDRYQEELERIRKLFKDHRDRTLALREGLFSASAVIESRASTRLGENVKLLTYVSIFYLPLTFCTGLWSTTDTFNFTTLAYVSVITALTTYVLTFNLSKIVWSLNAQYAKAKANVIAHMMKDEDASWKETGARFDRYRSQSNRKSWKPSEWWVLVYQFVRIRGALGLRKSVKKEDEKATSEASLSRTGTEGEKRESRWYSRVVTRRPTRPVAQGIDEEA